MTFHELHSSGKYLRRSHVLQSITSSDASQIHQTMCNQCAERESVPKRRFFCDGLPRDIWRQCKDELRCLKCMKRYSDWRSLRKHMNFFCQMEPLYPCPYCSHRARIPTLLKYHIVREHVGLASIEQSH
ncbi:PREDICTED: uncharacterized protein LOC108693987 [Atta colombica]|uniref:uncharacterized protein LOC108693987 n=1 Tax=Atta colombica TaxID=520822 RepID=UPI00084BF65C|nr:PREDICTED: uncharacterized protein LOC108693987 [Atta colombica]